MTDDNSVVLAAIIAELYDAAWLNEARLMPDLSRLQAIVSIHADLDVSVLCLMSFKYSRFSRDCSP
jgi:hypothetical protein